MRYRATVQYKPLIGSFRKIPRDRARALILADYDNSPMTGTETLRQSLNCRLKGATVEEFLAEREAAQGSELLSLTLTVDQKEAAYERYCNSKKISP